MIGVPGPLGVSEGLGSGVCVAGGSGWVRVVLGVRVGVSGVALAVGSGVTAVGVRSPVTGLGLLQPTMLTDRHNKSKMTVRVFMFRSSLGCYNGRQEIASPKLMPL